METRLAIIGLGYVGLPLAFAFSKKLSIVAFDIDEDRIADLKIGVDRTGEIEHEQFTNASIVFTSMPTELSGCNFFIVTVPTPVDRSKKPDLSNLISASRIVGHILKKGDTVVYESTVYPGCTEEDCLPILEQESGLQVNIDFFIGYSPERINPGDKVHTLNSIKKVVSGSTPSCALQIKALYETIIEAGTFLASSIRVAEASKVIENAQRDLNISFMNELALIFDRMNLDTTEVIEAASTKWNFLPFKPGLVGGHCIGVDPYYLTYKAESLGYFPQVILSGRRINENMGGFIAGRVVKLMIRKGQTIEGARALILGFTFKENMSDIRNSRVIDIVRELNEFGIKVDLYDPHANPKQVVKEYGVSLLESVTTSYDAIVLAVCHKEFLKFNLTEHSKKKTVVFDTKSFLPRDLVDGRL